MVMLVALLDVQLKRVDCPIQIVPGDAVIPADTKRSAALACGPEISPDSESTLKRPITVDTRKACKNVVFMFISISLFLRYWPIYARALAWYRYYTP